MGSAGLRSPALSQTTSFWGCKEVKKEGASRKNEGGGWLLNQENEGRRFC